MMKQTSPSLAICFKLLMTVIRILSDMYMSCWSTGCYLQGHVTVQMMKGVGWRHHSLGEEGAYSCISWRLDVSSLLHCMDNPHESPWLNLSTICVPINRRNHCISWPIMSVPSTDINLYLHIQTGSFKYPHLKILLGNEGCDNLSLYRQCSTWMEGWMSSAVGVEQRQGGQL